MSVGSFLRHPRVRREALDVRKFGKRVQSGITKALDKSKPRRHPYITPEGLKRLSDYQYKGNDSSLINRYLLSPLGDFLVMCLPVWLVPNVITLMALCCILSSHILLVSYTPTFSEAAPSWVHIFAGVMVLLNQALDNLDGKQARRTKTSSALGLVLDHGCDAIHAALGPITMMCSFGLGVSWRCFGFWFIAIVPFFMTTWEEYYTGEMDLPVINGPTEGMLTTASLHFLAAFVSSPGQFWGASLWSGCIFSRFDVLFVALSIGIATTCVRSFIRVRDMCNSLRSPAPGHPDVLDALKKLCPMIFVCTAVLMYYALNPTAFLENAVLLFYVFSLLFCQFVVTLQVSHVSDQDCRPWRVRYFVVVAFVLLSAFFARFSPESFPLSDRNVLLVCVSVNLMSYLHMAVTIIRQMLKELEINFFTRKSPAVKSH